MSSRNNKIRTTMVASFSEDIFIGILKRLPACSLLRFMLVQKSWHRLIQTPYFKALYSHHHKNNDYMILYDGSRRFICARVNDEHYYSLGFPKNMKPRDTMHFYGASKGLACFRYQDSQQIYLWNPVVGKYKTVPASPGLGVFYGDPILAFGYLPKMNDYRILEIRNPWSDTVDVDVYSLSTNSWKTVSLSTSKSLSIGGGSDVEEPVVVEGAAYWVGGFGQLICFDIEKEIIREIMLPPECSGPDPEMHYYFKVVRKGSDLSLLRVIMGRTLEIWILEKEAGIKDVWTKKKIAIDLDDIEGTRDWWPTVFKNNDEILLVNRFGRTEYMSCDIEKKELRGIFGDVWDLCSASYLIRQRIYQGILAENLDLLGED